MEYEHIKWFIQSMEQILNDPKVSCNVEVTFQCPICGQQAVVEKYPGNHATGFCRTCGIVCSK